MTTVVNDLTQYDTKAKLDTQTKRELTFNNIAVTDLNEVMQLVSDLQLQGLTKDYELLTKNVIPYSNKSKYVGIVKVQTDLDTPTPHHLFYSNVLFIRGKDEWLVIAPDSSKFYAIDKKIVSELNAGKVPPFIFDFAYSLRLYKITSKAVIKTFMKIIKESEVSYEFSATAAVIAKHANASDVLIKTKFNADVSKSEAMDSAPPIESKPQLQTPVSPKPVNERLMKHLVDNVGSFSLESLIVANKAINDEISRYEKVYKIDVLNKAFNDIITSLSLHQHQEDLDIYIEKFTVAIDNANIFTASKQIDSANECLKEAIAVLTELVLR